MDFTLKTYTKLCKAIASSKYKAVTVNTIVSMIDNISLKEGYIILRHDVDRLPKQALKLAEIEKEFGLVASYYFRVPMSLDAKTIERISEMGHEIGLHYESLDKAKKNIQKAGEFFEKELNTLRSITEVSTISMHGNPLTKYDNRDIWQYYKLSHFNIKGEAYLSMDFEKLMYYSETGRTWEDGKYNLKDTIPKGMKTISDKPLLKSTDDLINLIANDTRNIYLLTHPERWADSYISWATGYLRDIVLNHVKLILPYFIGNKQ